MNLTSAAFASGGDIPRRFTCEGDDISPPLSWSGAPPGTQSLALIVDDPDAPDPAAPKRTWVHWVLYNIPADATGLAEKCGARGGFPDARDGTNDWNRPGYGGPCPPIGRHRYFHKLYALDTKLPDLGGADKVRLLDAMKGHILAEATLMGGYEKSHR
ncbi:MAG TPA: YbhB/YbcL family Raf kinase inhibitor-like protein [Povalibacter sp.]|nr:YbhB/YbcL family Raf kinase inhibitor-like protein [Povalibacter sp.]